MNTYQPRAPHPGRRAAEPVTWPDSATSCNRLGTRGEGIRIEELTELSHHSFIQYKLPATGLGPRPVRVLPRHDADLLLGGGDVLMPQAEYFACPAVSCSKAKKNRSRSLVQASRIACVSAAVRIRGSFFGTLSAIARP